MPREELIKLSMEHYEKRIKEDLYYWIFNEKIQKTSEEEEIWKIKNI